MSQAGEEFISPSENIARIGNVIELIEENVVEFSLYVFTSTHLDASSMMKTSKI